MDKHHRIDRLYSLFWSHLAV